MTQALARAVRQVGKLGGLLAAWDPDLHPRDRRGRFRDKARMGPVKQVLRNFTPATFRSDQHAQSYLDTVSGRGGGRRSPRQRASLEYFQTSEGFDDIQSALDASAGGDLPQVRDLDSMMRPLPDDTLLTTAMGFGAFGLTPDRLGELDDWDDRLVVSKRYLVTNIGTPLSVDGPHVTVSMVVPRGTRAIVPGSSREVVLDRELPFRIMNIQPDGRGGAYVYAVVMPKSGTGEAPRGLGKKLTPLEKAKTAGSPEEVTGKVVPPAPSQAPMTPQGTARGIQEEGGQVPVGAGKVTAQVPEAPPAPTVPEVPPAPGPEPGPVTIQEPEAKPATPKTTVLSPPAPSGRAPSPRRLTPAQRKAHDERVVQQAKARERQRQMARSGAVAAVGTEVNGLAYGENASDDVIAQRVRAGTMSPRMEDIRDPKEREDLVRELEDIATEFEKGNRAEAQRRVDRLMRASRVELEGGAGRVVGFDEALHDAPAEPYPAGTRVRVVRPGARFVRDDGDIVHLSKPRVVAAGTVGRAPEAEPASTPSTQASPPSPTAPEGQGPDLTRFRPTSTRARNALRLAQRDLARGDDPERVADGLRSDAISLEEGEPLQQDDIPDRAGRGREELDDIARADAATLNRAADALETGATVTRRGPEAEPASPRTAVAEPPPAPAGGRAEADEIGRRLREANARSLVQERLDRNAATTGTDRARKAADDYRQGLLTEDDVRDFFAGTGAYAGEGRGDEEARGPGTVPGRRREATERPPTRATAPSPPAATSGARAIAPGDPRYVDVRKVGEGLNLRDEDERMLRSIQDDLDGGEGPGNAPKTPAAVGRLLEQRAKGPAGPYYRAAVITGVEDWKRRLADADRPGSPWTREQAQRGLAAAEARVSALRAQGDRWIALAERLKKTRRPPAARKAPARVAGRGPVAIEPTPEAREGAPPAPAPEPGRDLDKLLKRDLLQVARDEGATEVRDSWTKDRIRGAILTRRRGGTPKAPAKRTTTAKKVPAARAVKAEDAARQAYIDAGNRPGRDYMDLADLRDDLAAKGFSRDEQDEALRRLDDNRDGPGKPYLVPEDALDLLTQRDRDAAIRIGPEDRHRILFREAPTKAPAKKATPPAVPRPIRREKLLDGDVLIWEPDDGPPVRGRVGRGPRKLWVDWEGGRREPLAGPTPLGAGVRRATDEEAKDLPSGQITAPEPAREAPKKAARARQSPTDLANELKGAKTPDEARQHLDGLTNDELRAVARAVDAPVTSRDTKDVLRRKITEKVAGPGDGQAQPKAPTPEAGEAPPAPGRSPGAAAGKIRMTDIRPGDRILVRQATPKTVAGPVPWIPADRKTGATEITVTDVNPVAGRGGKRQVVGTDAGGNQVKVEPQAGVQTFLTRKVEPARPEGPQPSLRDLLDRLREFDNPMSRDEAHEMLRSLPKADLARVAGEVKIPGAARMSKDRLRREIVEGTVGARRDSIATRGFKGQRPDGPGPATQVSSATAPPLGRSRPRYDSENGPPLARPNADEPIQMPVLAMSGAAHMHANSAMGELWNDLYRDDRVPNSVLNRVMRAGLSMAFGDRGFNDILDDLRRLADSSDPVVAARVRQAVDSVDAPEVTLPDLPPSIPSKVTSALRALSRIPTARRTGRVGSGYADVDRSVLDRKLDAVQRIEAGDRQVGPDDPLRVLGRHDLHESVDGARQMWKLFDTLDSDPEVRRWAREAYARRKEPSPKADATAKTVATSQGTSQPPRPGGRTAFGDEVRASVASATTPQEVAQAVAAEASGIVGDDVRVDLAGADLDVARSFGEGVLRGLERYPASPLREVGTYGRGRTDGVSGTHNARMAAWDTGAGKAYAVTIRGGETNGAGGVYEGGDARLPGGTTTAGTAIYLNVDTGRRAWEDLAVTGRLAREGLVDRQQVSTTPLGVALHESAHSVAAHGRPHKPADAVGRKARELAGGRDIRRFVADNVSVYATTSDEELAAEVVADVELNGVAGVGDVTRRLFEVFEANARGWEEEVTR
jgi:hypothetical protein